MTKRTWAKIGFAALALLLIVFAADIVLLVFASILLAILLRSLARTAGSTFAHISAMGARDCGRAAGTFVWLDRMVDRTGDR